MQIQNPHCSATDRSLQVKRSRQWLSEPMCWVGVLLLRLCLPPIKAQCAFCVRAHLSHTTRPLPPPSPHTFVPTSAPITTSYLVDMFKHTKPSMQGAQRQGGSSPSYPERPSLPPFRDSVPNNYVPSVRKTAAAAPSAQSQPPMYHPSHYERAPQTNHATMSPVAAAKHLVSWGDTVLYTVMLLLTRYLSLSRSTQVLVCFVSSP